MLNLSACSLIVWFYFAVQQSYSKESYSLRTEDIKHVLYFHNIYRYLTTVGRTNHQPSASDMKFIRWNQSLAISIDSIMEECILEPNREVCPPINVYRVENRWIEVSKIFRAWFDANVYYDFSTDSCAMSSSCRSYKIIMNSDTTALGCSIRKLNSYTFFICQYSHGKDGRPYTIGRPCSQCSKPFTICYKKRFCTIENECSSDECDELLTKYEENEMQADQPNYCLSADVNCKINFYQHMCPKICADNSLLRNPETTIDTTTTTTTPTTPTVMTKPSSDNEVCKLAGADCSITFFKILCPKLCDSVLCRDPNIECRNIYYAKCPKCQLMNEKMSDSRITSTTMASSLEQAIILSDAKCQDLPYDNYCIDRGEMCLHATYEVWMKKFCCNTCRILDICFDYLDFKTPGKCADILSLGLCSSLWSQTYCKKTCKKC